MFSRRRGSQPYIYRAWTRVLGVEWAGIYRAWPIIGGSILYVHKVGFALYIPQAYIQLTFKLIKHTQTLLSKLLPKLTEDIRPKEVFYKPRVEYLKPRTRP